MFNSLPPILYEKVFVIKKNSTYESIYIEYYYYSRVAKTVSCEINAKKQKQHFVCISFELLKQKRIDLTVNMQQPHDAIHVIFANEVDLKNRRHFVCFCSFCFRE